MGFFTKSGSATGSSINEVTTDEEAANSTPASVTNAEWKPSTHEWLIMITLSILSLMTALDACVIITSLTSIVEDLGLTNTQGFWIGTAYLLTMGVFMPFISSLSDIFGRPICLWLSVLCFTVGSIMCCTAKGIALLLAGRSVQGIGGGGIVCLALVIFTDLVPLRFRPKYYGVVLSAWAMGNSAGPLIGGAIAQNTTWRWIFYIMLPFCAFGLITIPFLLTLKPRTATMGEKLRRVDWLGGFIFITSSTLFLMAISWGGSEFAWNSAQTLAPLIVGFVGLMATFFYENMVASEPFLLRRLFRDVSSVAVYFCGLFQGFILYAQLYYIPFYFMAVLGFSPIHAGVACLPTMVFFVPGSIITGGIVTRTNNFRYPIWVGWLFDVVGAALYAFLFTVDTSTGGWVIAGILSGIGSGAILNAQNFATQAICGPGDEGAAAAMYAFVRQFGMALGVGIGSSAFQNVMALKLGWEGLPTEIAKNAEAYAVVLARLPDSEADYKARVLDCYMYGFKGVFLVVFAAAVLTALVSGLIRHVDMNRAIDTEHTLEDNRVARVIEARMSAAVTPNAKLKELSRISMQVVRGRSNSDGERDGEVKREVNEPVPVGAEGNTTKTIAFVGTQP